jgi:hypothetical protein
MTIYLAPLVAIIGLIIFLTVNDPKFAKASEVGKIMFFSGLLVFLLQSGASHVLRIP